MYGDTLLTTMDNPYNPFTQFSQWFLYDEGMGYHTCGLIARIARTSDAFSDKENEEEFKRACNEVIKTDFTNKYITLNRNKKFDIKEINRLYKEANKATA
ncbi:MAG: hypothetical protein LIP10_03530 [Clostridiales bacterium]|nr:hypothetical protein [Clostridiales bacterium]